MAGRYLVDQYFSTLANNVAQAFRLRDFAQHASLALQCIAKSSDFAIHQLLQSPFLFLGESLDERKQLLREYEAFRDQVEYEQVAHCDSGSRTVFGDHANILKAECWMKIFSAPMNTLTETYTDVS